MARVISPLTLEDLPELSQFLTAGFKAPADADFAAPDVLRWKYLDPINQLPHATEFASGSQRQDQPHELNISVQQNADFTVPCSFIARNNAGQIIGHIGICRTTFEGQSLASHGGQVPTIHIIDWIGSPEYRAIGMSLMRKAHEGTSTQFGLGVSQAALVVGERTGYKLRSQVAVYTRVVRTRYWLRAHRLSLLQRGLQLTWNTKHGLTNPQPSRGVRLTLKRVLAFGAEICPIVQQAKAHIVLTKRDPARLNSFLRFPRQTVTGWHIIDQAGHLRGYALLNLIPHETGRIYTGKIVDCLLDEVNVILWQEAFLALNHELFCQGADIVQAYASTPWCAEALEQCGFWSRFAVKFHIRDRQGVIPWGTRFYLTPLEGDYAYT